MKLKLEEVIIPLMCGIFGTFGNYEKYLQLYKKNRERGDFAFGGLFVNKKRYVVLRTPETFNFTIDHEFKFPDDTMTVKDFDVYLGHTQAPTSSKRNFDPKTSHPFQCHNWIVAHNGVLTNYNQIAKEIIDTTTFNEVDTSLIPALLHQYEGARKTEVELICDMCGLLQGTFGLWIFNSLTGNIFLARSGSTLYAEYLTNEFSSVKEPHMHELEEGVLYQTTREGLTSVGTFTSQSPFYL